MNKQYLAEKVVNLKPSGIRKFFDIVATMQDVISLGIGEPDFTTPNSILDVGIRSLKSGATHSHQMRTLGLRRQLRFLNYAYGVAYNPQKKYLLRYVFLKPICLTDRLT